MLFPLAEPDPRAVFALLCCSCCGCRAHHPRAAVTRALTQRREDIRPRWARVVSRSTPALRPSRYVPKTMHTPGTLRALPQNLHNPFLRIHRGCRDYSFVLARICFTSSVCSFRRPGERFPSLNGIRFHRREPGLPGGRGVEGSSSLWEPENVILCGYPATLPTPLSTCSSALSWSIRTSLRSHPKEPVPEKHGRDGVLNNSSFCLLAHQTPGCRSSTSKTEWLWQAW